MDVQIARSSTRAVVATFQAPDLYGRMGYQEVALVPGLLADGVEDVWFVKQLDQPYALDATS